MSTHDENLKPQSPAMHFESFMDCVYRFEIVKSGHRFLFSCQAGQEKELLHELTLLAGDTDCVLDWFDVAVFSHQMSERLAHQLEKLFDYE